MTLVRYCCCNASPAVKCCTQDPTPNCAACGCVIDNTSTQAQCIQDGGFLSAGALIGCHGQCCTKVEKSYGYDFAFCADYDFCSCPNNIPNSYYGHPTLPLVTYTSAQQIFDQDLQCANANFFIRRYGGNRQTAVVRDIRMQPVGGVDYATQTPLLDQDEYACEFIWANTTYPWTSSSGQSYKQKIMGTYTWAHNLGSFSTPFTGYFTRLAGGTPAYNCHIDSDYFPMTVPTDSSNYDIHNAKKWLEGKSWEYVNSYPNHFNVSTSYFHHQFGNGNNGATLTRGEQIQAGDILNGYISGFYTNKDLYLIGRPKSETCIELGGLPPNYQWQLCTEAVSGDAAFAPQDYVINSDWYRKTWTATGTLPANTASTSANVEFKVFKKGGAGTGQTFAFQIAFDGATRGWKATNNNNYPIFGIVGNRWMRSSNVAQDQSIINLRYNFNAAIITASARQVSSPLGAYPYPHSTNGYSNVTISSVPANWTREDYRKFQEEILIDDSSDDLDDLSMDLTTLPAITHTNNSDAVNAPIVNNTISVTLTDANPRKNSWANITKYFEWGAGVVSQTITPPTAVIKMPELFICQSSFDKEGDWVGNLGVDGNCEHTMVFKDESMPNQSWYGNRQRRFFSNFVYGGITFQVNNPANPIPTVQGCNERCTAHILLSGQSTQSIDNYYIAIKDGNKTLLLFGDNFLGTVSGGLRFKTVPSGQYTTTITATSLSSGSVPLNRFTSTMVVPVGGLSHGIWDFWFANSAFTYLANAGGYGRYTMADSIYVYGEPSAQNTNAELRNMPPAQYAVNAEPYTQVVGTTFFNGYAKNLYMKSLLAPFAYGYFTPNNTDLYSGWHLPPNDDAIEIQGVNMTLLSGNGVNQMQAKTLWKTGAVTGEKIYDYEPTLSCMTVPNESFTGTQTVKFKTRGGEAVVNSITSLATPKITGISPPRGIIAGGYDLTLTGTNLSQVVGLHEARINNRSNSGTTIRPDFTIVSQTNTQIVLTVTPAVYTFAGLASGGVEPNDYNLIMQGNVGGLIFDFYKNQMHGGNQFLFVNAPVITSKTPPTGTIAGGTTVTVDGRNFKWVNSITIGGVSVTYTLTTTGANAYKRFTFVTPSSVAGVVDIVINTDGGTSSIPFTYV